MNIRWTLINMTNSLDLKILQITWNVPNWRNEFSWTEIEFLEVIADKWYLRRCTDQNYKHEALRHVEMFVDASFVAETSSRVLIQAVQTRLV